MSEPRRLPLMFVCRPLHAKLTHASCARRYLAVNDPHRGEKRPQNSPSLSDTMCDGCPIGEAHNAGKRPSAWEDGMPIELVDPSGLDAARERAIPPHPRSEPWKIVERREPVSALDHPSDPPQQDPQPNLSGGKSERRRQRYVATDAVMLQKNVVYEVDGFRMTGVDHAARLGMTFVALYLRVRSGWSIERALRTPRMDGYRRGERRRKVPPSADSEPVTESGYRPAVEP